MLDRLARHPEPVMDVLFVAVILALFALTAALVVALEKLRSPS